MENSLPSAYGETFKVGDKVALRPDVGFNADVKDHGVVRAISARYAGYHIEVEWEGESASCVHIDRITHRRSK